MDHWPQNVVFVFFNCQVIPCSFLCFHLGDSLSAKFCPFSQTWFCFSSSRLEPGDLGPHPSPASLCPPHTASSTRWDYLVDLVLYWSWVFTYGLFSLQVKAPQQSGLCPTYLCIRIPSNSPVSVHKVFRNRQKMPQVRHSVGGDGALMWSPALSVSVLQNQKLSFSLLYLTLIQAQGTDS